MAGRRTTGSMPRFDRHLDSSDSQKLAVGDDRAFPALAETLPGKTRLS